MSRFRKPKVKDGELLVKYGKDSGDEDLFYYWNGDVQMKRDTKLLMNAFENTKLLFDKTLRQELIERGYDITTLKFSIMKNI